VVWERGRAAIHRAIMWQDRRTAEECARLRWLDSPTLAGGTGLADCAYTVPTLIASSVTESMRCGRGRSRRGFIMNAGGRLDCHMNVTCDDEDAGAVASLGSS
jgi:glycerol kinase